MSSTPHDHDAEPVTDHVHDNSWSADLELPEHGGDRELVVRHALDAVEHAAAGNHVNPVTHATHGHPSACPFTVLGDGFGDDVDWEYVEQCGCGGHVVRVHA
jgi:putative CGCGG family rSAM target protein